MYAQYEMIYDGKKLILYVRNELQGSYERLSNSFPSAKMTLADYILDTESGEWVKFTESAEGFEGHSIH